VRIIIPQAMRHFHGRNTGGEQRAGEVAPIMFTGAAYYLPYLPGRLNDHL